MFALITQSLMICKRRSFFETSFVYGVCASVYPAYVYILLYCILRIYGENTYVIIGPIYDVQAGDADVRVEYRGGAEERFGQGLERAMKFGNFVGELERKNDLLYLTTQVKGTEGGRGGSRH